MVLYVYQLTLAGIYSICAMYVHLFMCDRSSVAQFTLYTRPERILNDFVCRRSSLLPGEGGREGVGEELNHSTARKPGPL